MGEKYVYLVIITHVRLKKKKKLEQYPHCKGGELVLMEGMGVMESTSETLWYTLNLPHGGWTVTSGITGYFVDIWRLQRANDGYPHRNNTVTSIKIKDIYLFAQLQPVGNRTSKCCGSFTRQCKSWWLRSWIWHFTIAYVNFYLLAFSWQSVVFFFFFLKKTLSIFKQVTVWNPPQCSEGLIAGWGLKDTATALLTVC